MAAAVELTRIVAGLEENGYAIVAGFLDDREVATLGAAASDLAASVGYEPTAGGGFLHRLGAAYAHPHFTDLAVDDRMLGVLGRVLTPNIHVYHSHLDIHPPEEPSDAWRWHEDGGRMTADLDVRARLSVKVAYFLSDVETDGLGNMMVIPGSHRWTEPLPRTPGREPDGAEPVLARAGDALLFDRRIWHSRSTNTSDRTRVAVFFGYAPRWIAQREPPPAELLARETAPVRRQVLGAQDWDTCHVARADLPVAGLVAAPA